MLERLKRQMEAALSEPLTPSQQDRERFMSRCGHRGDIAEATTAEPKP